MGKISFDYNEMRESGWYISRCADMASGHITRRIHMHHTTVELQIYIYINKNDTIYYKFITRTKVGLVMPICI